MNLKHSSPGFPIHSFWFHSKKIFWRTLQRFNSLFGSYPDCTIAVGDLLNVFTMYVYCEIKSWSPCRAGFAIITDSLYCKLPPYVVFPDIKWLHPIIQWKHLLFSFRWGRIPHFQFSICYYKDIHRVMCGWLRDHAVLRFVYSRSPFPLFLCHFSYALTEQVCYFRALCSHTL